VSIEQIILLLGGVAGLLSAIAVIYTALKNSKNNQITSKANIDARIDARVDREMARLEALVEDMERSLEAAHDRIEAQDRKLDAQGAEIRAQRQEIVEVKRDRNALELIVAKLVARNNEIIDHVITLESGYPNPPGPPPRPWSDIPDIHFN